MTPSQNDTDPRKTVTRLDPNGDKFPWGRVVAEHIVGPYIVLEYTRNPASNVPGSGGEISFHGYIEVDHLDQETGTVKNARLNDKAWYDCSWSWSSLDEALVGLVAYSKGGSSATQHLAPAFLRGLAR